MRPESTASKRLEALYRMLICRLRRAQRAARMGVLERIPLRLNIERLQPRLLFSSASPVGGETLVNTLTSVAMTSPAVAMDPAGSAVVVWSTSATSGGVFGQRYAANGSTSGAQFQIDSIAASSNAAPSVAMDDFGDFVVVWNGPGSHVFARLYNSSGSALTSDILVSASKVGSSRSVVAMNAGGGFVVAWEGSGAADSDGIYSRTFLASGVASSDAVLVNVTTAGVQTNPAIAMNASGAYTIAWTDQSTTPSAIKAAYVSASGTATSEFAAGAEAGKAEDNATVGIDAAGAFLIAWQTNFGGGNSWDITGTGFSASAAALNTQPVTLNSTTNDAQIAPAVAVRPDGSYQIIWISDNQSGNATGVYFSTFATNGSTASSEALVNSTTSGLHENPATAISGNSLIIAWDGNGAGDSAGVFLQRYTIAGSANQAPVNTVPPSQTIIKNTPLTFNSTNAISINDSDAYGGYEQVALTATSGSLTLAQTTGLIFSSGAATASAQMTFSGTIANINAALSGMIYVPTSGYTGSGNVKIVTSDLGNTGAGGALTATSNVAITITAPPTSNSFPASVSTAKNTNLTFSPGNNDALYIGTGWNYIELDVTRGTVTLATTSGLSISSGTGSGDTKVQFGGSITAMNAALNGLIFTPASGYTGLGSIKITTSNSGLLGLGLFGSSTSATVSISITALPAAVNQPPVIVVAPTQSDAENVPLVLHAAGNQGISISDADAGGAAEQVTLVATSGTITLGQLSGLTFTAGDGTADSSMTFTGTLVSIDAALDGLTFTPASLFAGTGGIYVYANDQGNSGTGGAQTAAAAITVNVSQVNQAPTVTVPLGRSAAGGSTITFSNSGNDAIVIGDSDANGAFEQLTLSTTNGTLNIASTTGLTLTSGANGSAAMTLTGTIANLNAALDGLTLTPANGFIGTATVNVGINDLGNSGSGGALSASGSVAITFVSSLIVTTAADTLDGDTSSINALLASPGADGLISLREAITAADNTPGAHEIDFDIAGSGVQTISVTSALPPVTSAMTIDGTTEPGYAGAPIIELDGQAASFGTIGLSIEASGCIIRGLAVYGFSGNGIDVLPVGANNETIQGNYIGITAGGVAIYNGVGLVLANSANDIVGGTTALQRNVISGNFSEGIHIFGPGSTGDIVEGNYIGTDPTGTAAIANGGDGIFIDGASNDTIGLAAAGGGNVISGNGGYGIEVAGTTPADNVIQNNYIGVNALGTGALSNGNDGIVLTSATGTLIGGTSASQRNIISGNTNAGNSADGIWIDAGSSNTVSGNYIGIDATGNTAMGNFAAGVVVQDSPNNTIGGTAAGMGNVISGNGAQGLVISGASASGNLIEGNIVGLNAAGNAIIANGSDGIWLDNTQGNTIGGSTPGAGNIISGNNNSGANADGIWIDFGSANTVQGNTIGTDSGQTSNFGNYHAGVDITTSTGNIIGGVNAGEGNFIEYNGKGVVVTGAGATGNTIRGNTITANVSMGIDLGDDGVTVNSGSLNGSGPNQGMNDPVFTSVYLLGNALFLQGYVGSAPGQAAFAGTVIDLYKADGSLANGQGWKYLGAVVADASGNISQSIAVAGISNGDLITATAIDANGDTSEFAANATVVLTNLAPVLDAPASANTGENVPVVFSNAGGDAITISDFDSAGGIEQLSLSVGSGTLSLGSAAGLTFINGTSNGSALLTFTGTVANLSSALDGLTYVPEQDSGGATTLSINADDLGHTGGGGNQTSSASISIVVNLVANTPSVTGASTTANTQTTDGLVITPNLSDGTAQGYYQITQITGGTLYQNDGVTPIIDGQFITFAQGSAGLTFTPALNSVAAGHFTIQAASAPNVSGLVGTTALATIAINGPVSSVPAPQSMAEDQTLVFSAGNGNAITVVDAVGGSIAVALSSSNGTLTLGNVANLTGLSGNGTSSITFIAAPADVNAALEGMTFTPTTHFSGDAGVAIVVGDISNSTSSSVDVSVTPVAHTPAISDAATNENQQTGSGLVITPNSLDGSITLYYQVTGITGGTLYLADGITPVAEDSFITASQGSAGLKFTPATNSIATGSLSIQASTAANASGLDGSVVTAQISVAAVVAPTSPPELIANNPLTATQGQASLIGPALLEAAEQGAAASDLTFTITIVPGHGALYVNGLPISSGGSFTEADIDQGRLTYVPAGAAGTDDSFTFIVSDANGVSRPASVFTIHTAAAPVTPGPSPTPPPLPQLPVAPVSLPVFVAPPASLPVLDSGSNTPVAPAGPSNQAPASDSSSTTDGSSSTDSTGDNTDDHSRLTPSPTISPLAAPVVSTLIGRVGQTSQPDTSTMVSAQPVRADEALLLTDNIVMIAPNEKLAIELAALDANVRGRNQNILGLSDHGSYVLTGNSPAALAANSPLWHELDEMQDQAKSDRKMHFVAGAASLASVGMSVMYFMWAVRAGSVLSSLVSSMPAWKLVDPLPILDQMAAGLRGRKGDGDDDDETLQSMVDNQPEPA